MTEVLLHLAARGGVMKDKDISLIDAASMLEGGKDGKDASTNGLTRPPSRGALEESGAVAGAPGQADSPVDGASEEAEAEASSSPNNTQESDSDSPVQKTMIEQPLAESTELSLSAEHTAAEDSSRTGEIPPGSSGGEPIQENVKVISDNVVSDTNDNSNDAKSSLPESRNKSSREPSTHAPVVEVEVGNSLPSACLPPSANDDPSRDEPNAIEEDSTGTVRDQHKSVGGENDNGAEDVTRVPVPSQDIGEGTDETKGDAASPSSSEPAVVQQLPSEDELSSMPPIIDRSDSVKRTSDVVGDSSNETHYDADVVEPETAQNLPEVSSMLRTVTTPNDGAHLTGHIPTQDENLRKSVNLVDLDTEAIPSSQHEGAEGLPSTAPVTDAVSLAAAGKSGRDTTVEEPFANLDTTYPRNLASNDTGSVQHAASDNEEDYSSDIRNGVKDKSEGSDLISFFGDGEDTTIAPDNVADTSASHPDLLGLNMGSSMLPDPISDSADANADDAVKSREDHAPSTIVLPIVGKVEEDGERHDAQDDDRRTVPANETVVRDTPTTLDDAAEDEGKANKEIDLTTTPTSDLGTPAAVPGDAEHVDETQERKEGEEVKGESSAEVEGADKSTSSTSNLANVAPSVNATTDDLKHVVDSAEKTVSPASPIASGSGHVEPPLVAKESMGYTPPVEVVPEHDAHLSSNAEEKTPVPDMKDDVANDPFTSSLPEAETGTQEASSSSDETMSSIQSQTETPEESTVVPTQIDGAEQLPSDEITGQATESVVESVSSDIAEPIVVQITEPVEHQDAQVHSSEGMDAQPAPEVAPDAVNGQEDVVDAQTQDAVETKPGGEHRSTEDSAISLPAAGLQSVDTPTIRSEELLPPTDCGTEGRQTPMDAPTHSDSKESGPVEPSVSDNAHGSVSQAEPEKDAEQAFQEADPESEVASTSRNLHVNASPLGDGSHDEGAPKGASGVLEVGQSLAPEGVNTLTNSKEADHFLSSDNIHDTVLRSANPGDDVVETSQDANNVDEISNVTTNVAEDTYPPSTISQDTIAQKVLPAESVDNAAPHNDMSESVAEHSTAVARDNERLAEGNSANHGEAVDNSATHSRRIPEKHAGDVEEGRDNVSHAVDDPSDIPQGDAPPAYDSLGVISSTDVIPQENDTSVDAIESESHTQLDINNGENNLPQINSSSTRPVGAHVPDDTLNEELIGHDASRDLQVTAPYSSSPKSDDRPKSPFIPSYSVYSLGSNNVMNETTVDDEEWDPDNAGADANTTIMNMEQEALARSSQSGYLGLDALRGGNEDLNASPARPKSPFPDSYSVTHIGAGSHEHLNETVGLDGPPDFGSSLARSLSEATARAVPVYRADEPDNEESDFDSDEIRPEDSLSEIASDVAEVPLTPRSDLGIYTPSFDSRSEISVASHLPIPPSSPRLDPEASIVLENEVLTPLITVPPPRVGSQDTLDALSPLPVRLLQTDDSDAETELFEEDHVSESNESFEDVVIGDGDDESILVGMNDAFTYEAPPSISESYAANVLPLTDPSATEEELDNVKKIHADPAFCTAAPELEQEFLIRSDARGVEGDEAEVPRREREPAIDNETLPDVSYGEDASEPVLPLTSPSVDEEGLVTAKGIHTDPTFSKFAPEPEEELVSESDARAGEEYVAKASEREQEPAIDSEASVDVGYSEDVSEPDHEERDESSDLESSGDALADIESLEPASTNASESGWTDDDSARLTTIGSVNDDTLQTTLTLPAPQEDPTEYISDIPKVIRQPDQGGDALHHSRHGSSFARASGDAETDFEALTDSSLMTSTKVDGISELDSIRETSTLAGPSDDLPEIASSSSSIAIPEFDGDDTVMLDSLPSSVKSQSTMDERINEYVSIPSGLGEDLSSVNDAQQDLLTMPTIESDAESVDDSETADIEPLDDETVKYMSDGTATPLATTISEALSPTPRQVEGSGSLLEFEMIHGSRRREFPSKIVSHAQETTYASKPALEQDDNDFEPIAPPVVPRKRLESTASSRFPGSWVSSSPTIPQRPSLDNAQGEFSRPNISTTMPGTTPALPSVVEEDKKRCIIM